MLILHMKRYCLNRRSIRPNFLLLVWLYTVEFNRLPYPNTKTYEDVVFADRFRYLLAMFGNRHMDRVISTTSCSYCICHRYSQNHRRILPNFLLFVRLYAVEFNRLPCPNDKIYDNVVFADRFRYPLTMFGNRVMIGLSRLIHAHFAYETDTAKIIALFCQISYCLQDLIRLNSIVCHVQITRYTII